VSWQKKFEKIWNGERFSTGSVSDLNLDQVAYAPRTVMELTPLSCIRYLNTLYFSKDYCSLRQGGQKNVRQTNRRIPERAGVTPDRSASRNERLLRLIPFDLLLKTERVADGESNDASLFGPITIRADPMRNRPYVINHPSVA
jgi:hypothetical protein